MAEHQRKIKTKVKQRLIDAAGGKCANPGCSNRRVEIHHIKHWAIYKCHSEPDMIAICPSCHDNAHHGTLKISDEILYMWKEVAREGSPHTAHLYVEPSSGLKLFGGNATYTTTNSQMTLFELSNKSRLKFRVVDGDLLQVSAAFHNSSGKEVLRVVENNVRVRRDKNVSFEFRAGRARVTVPSTADYLPDYAVAQVREFDPTFWTGSRAVLLDLEVIKPGVVRAEGFWVSNEGAIVLTAKAAHFCFPGSKSGKTLVGTGLDSGLIYDGPATSPLFDIS